MRQTSRPADFPAPANAGSVIAAALLLIELSFLQVWAKRFMGKGLPYLESKIQRENEKEKGMT